MWRLGGIAWFDSRCNSLDNLSSATEAIVERFLHSVHVHFYIRPYVSRYGFCAPPGTIIHHILVMLTASKNRDHFHFIFIAVFFVLNINNLWRQQLGEPALVSRDLCIIQDAAHDAT